MSAWHCCLSEPGRPAPARWREAFPEGLALDLPGLQAWLARAALGEGMVWLHATGRQWPAQLAALAAARPGLRVVVLADEPQDQEALRALDAGASGYAHACAVPPLLREIALVVLHGGLWVGPGLMQRALQATSLAVARERAGECADGSPEDGASGWERLSAREAEVARAILEGLCNKEVAARLQISERTVKAHLGIVFSKLGVRDRLQLALRLSAPRSPRLIRLADPPVPQREPTAGRLSS